MSSPVNTSDHKLKRYSIPINRDIHPLIYALRIYRIPTASVEFFINGGPTLNPYHIVPRNVMRLIADKLQVNITVVYLNARDQCCWIVFPRQTPYGKTIRLACYNNHYFVHERMRSINYSPTVLRVIDALTSIEQITWPATDRPTIAKTFLFPLRDILHEQSEFVHKPSRGLRKATVSYADIECVTKPRHVPMMYGRYTNGQYYSVSRGYDEDLSGFKAFLEGFPNGDHIVYFHNLKYDWSVVKRNPHIRIREMLKTDGIYYCVKFQLYAKHFEFRDSYKYIPRKLSEFAAMFNLPNKIDCILYDLYTPENTTDVDSVVYSNLEEKDIPEIVYQVSDSKVEKVPTLISPVSDYIYLDNRVAVSRDYLKLAPQYFHQGVYYHRAHCELYLRRDCELLFKGMEAYRTQMKGLFELDCHSKLTLPSIVHERMCSVGCYDGVYQLSDSLRRFVTQSVHGGRVTSRDNKMWDVKGVNQVLDGRSLYPSAISRICQPTLEDARDAGFPRGAAKLITDWSTRETFFHYIVRIRVTAIRKYQQIPFVTYYRDEARQYTNRVEDLNGEDLVVDKITLEDWIKFQDIEYEFVEGIYWDSGGNTTVGEFVRSLYAARREYAKMGNESMSQVCKLGLNSLFGKTILKPKTVKMVIRDEDKFEEYLAGANFEDVCGKIERCGQQFVIPMSTPDINHSNLCQVGGLILSMARRIMNELLALANDLGIPVLYTDTDSLHIIDRLKPEDSSNIARLEAAYLEMYGRQLLGAELGQFASELKFPGHTNIASRRVIILGKKAYMHVIEGTNSAGVVETYNYCRMKAINSYAISEYKDELKLYERLYANESIRFDLAYGNAVNFQIRGDVTTKTAFLREIKFRGEKGVL